MSVAQGDRDRRAVLRDALLRIEELERELDRLARAGTEPIAIVGIGCRFPGGAHGPDAYWQCLCDGVDAIGEVPTERWDIATYYDPDPDAPGKTYSRWGGFLSDVAGFDADFFGVAPREATKMDPQHRLVLEVAWEALEHAGCPPARLEGSPTGVFLGVTGTDYLQRLNRQGPERIDAYHMTGNCLNFAAGRLAYLLGLQGPALAMDSACSSSLVAVHLACQSLRAGECGAAIAGGVNLILSPEMAITLSKARMLAPDGRCKTFDARANGYVRGEGCGIVVLKRLADALADGDRIVAQIRGSAVNQDGKSSGLTVPNKLAQEAVIRAALTAAGVRPADVGYVEAHGTGTALGDPIEVRALAAVLGLDRDRARPLLLGSAKTNIGHLESAAGIAGLIKLVLCLQHGQIPPHLHFRTPSPHIAWDELPVAVPTTLTPWPDGGPRIGGVSAFGGSGTNAHAILEAPSDVARAATSPRLLHLVPVSARTQTALCATAARLEGRLAEAPELSLEDVAFTASAGRTHFQARAAVVAASGAEVREGLRSLAAGEVVAGVTQGTAGRSAPKVGFLFTGQGAQYVGMGRGLFQTEPIFRQALLRCDGILRPLLPRPLLAVMHGQPDTPGLLDETQYAQPALFALEYALCELWRAWGVHPALVMGHSVGELAAACAAGLWSLEDGLRLVAARGRLMQALPAGGAMAAVFAEEARVAAAIGQQGGRLAVAALNEPGAVVVSGEGDSVRALAEAFAAKGVRTQALRVSHAFHSPLVEPMLEEFERVAAALTYAPPELRIISNLTGRVAAAEELSYPAYWRRHVREPVRFAAGMAALGEQDCQVFLEIGPHPTLLGMGARCLPEGTGLWVPSLRKGRDDQRQLLESLAAVYARGVDVDWAAVHRDRPGRTITLPGYPFEHRRFWVEAEAPRPVQARRAEDVVRGHPLLGARLPAAVTEVLFESRLSIDSPPFLGDHRVGGEAVVPAAAFLEMGLAAAALVVPQAPAALEDVLIREPLVLPPNEIRVVQLVLTPLDEGGRLTISSRAEDELAWRLHVEAVVPRSAPAPEAVPSSLATLQAECGETVAAETHYAALERRGLTFGPAFSGLKQLWRGAHCALGYVEMPAPVAAGVDAYQLHPALLDACLQVVGILLPEGAAGDTYLPMSVERLQLAGKPGSRVWSHARLRQGMEAGAGSIVADVRMLDEGGGLIAAITGLRLVRALRSRADQHRRMDDWFYELAWEPRSLPAVVVPATATPFLPPHAIAAEVVPLLPPLATATRLSRYVGLLPEIDALCAGYIRRALADLGWAWYAGERVTGDTLAARLGVRPAHRRLFGRLLTILSEEGLLRQEAAIWEVVHAEPAPEAEALARSMIALHGALPDCAALLTLLERCGGELAAALRGEQDVLALLFPAGSLTLAEGLNQEAPFSRFHNGTVGEVVARLVAALPAGRRLRVLEVGAGTGSATAAVLPRLPADRTEYVFTDLSTLFTVRAAEKFRAYSFVRYGILNIEQDPGGQGYTPGGFDLVVAANVLHATRDLGETIGHVRRLLAPGGALVLLEGMESQRWVDLTFGLTDGWWRFTDTTRRPAYPLLTAAGWSTLLAEYGFEGPAFLPDVEAPEAAMCQQAVILARVPVAATEPAVGGEWLLFADAAGLARDLADRLADAGATATLVRPGAKTEKTADGSWTLDPTRPEDSCQLLRGPAGGPWTGVVHLWSLDAASEPETPAALEAVVAFNCGSVLHLVQALASDGRASGFRGLWLVTRGAQAADASGPVAVSQSPLVGLAKVAALEHPELGVVHVDLAPAGSDEAALLLAEILRGDGEDQVALRAEGRLAARARRWAQPQPADPQPVRLEAGAPGLLDALALRPAPRRAPGPGEVEIRVRAAGLNFRDVLCALDMYPGAPGPLGVECAGEVAAVGEGVVGLRVGDEVVALAPGSLATFVTTDVRLTAPRPSTLTAEEAATIPSVFVTAWYALHHLGRLAKGERVLIHAGSGGVGLAALQIARAAGAEVLATAGSPEKRAFLRATGLRHVMDSRSLDFARETMDATDGRGVDVVLNALTGDAIPAGLSVLAPGGRFIELGQREVWDAARVAAVRADVSYQAFNLLAIAAQDPGRVASLLGAVLEEFRAERFTPLPRRTFPLADAVSAFRHMAQARHIGKIVLTPPAAAREAGAVLLTDGSYLVTGGLGGLGLLVAEWLAAHGAGNLVLLSRREPNEAARARIRRLEAGGTRVVIAQADVSRVDQVSAVLADVRQSLPPLRGVVHAAGTLDDGVLLQQEWRRFAAVMAPKVSGAWILDALTREAPLDFFVCFSSAVSFLGRAGQGNHAAANAFEDALAHARRRRGLPATTINWGPWGEVGSVMRDGVAGRVAAQGFTPFPPEDGLRALERVLIASPAQVAVMAVDWSRFLAGIPEGREPRLLTTFAAEVTEARRRQPATASQKSREPAILEQLVETPPARRAALLVEFVRRHAVRVLGLDAARPVDPTQPLHGLGLDSLMAVELRNALGAAVGRSLPATLLFDYPTLDALAGHLGRLLAPPRGCEAAGPAAVAARGSQQAQEIAQLSEAEAEALLLTELKAPRG